jgi:ribosomal protein S18 acetylase RimI-like enzyme
MAEPLDNPIWHALIGPHARFASGAGRARHYFPDVTPFSAIADTSEAAYADLAASLPPGVQARMLFSADGPTPPGWETASTDQLVQMIADDVVALDPDARGELLVLGAGDVPDMLALAELARPGPFGPRTHELGHYVGYRDGGRLLAMGGERMRLPGLVEVSAISVHPDVRGRGLGAAIVSYLGRRAMARGEVPFLHAFPDNPAVALYRRLGFRERTRLWMKLQRVAGPARA